MIFSRAIKCVDGLNGYKAGIVWNVLCKGHLDILMCVLGCQSFLAFLMQLGHVCYRSEHLHFWFANCCLYRSL